MSSHDIVCGQTNDNPKDEGTHSQVCYSNNS